MKPDTPKQCKSENTKRQGVQRLRRFLYISLGLSALTLGAVGTVMPFIPTTPLVLMAAFCFGKSSRRLQIWFLATKLYKKNLESFVQRRGMTIKTKIVLLATVTFFMGLSFIAMIVFSVHISARIVLGVVWFFHVIYFVFKVETIR